MFKPLLSHLHSAISTPKQLAAVVVIASLATGCASLTPSDGAATDVPTSDSMLEDVLSVMPQLLQPRTNSIQFGPDAGALDVIAARNLAEAGYGIQRVSADQGTNFFTVEKNDNDNGVTRLRVSIGELEVTRIYALEDGEILPAGPFELAGTRARIDPTKSKLGSSVSTDAIVSSVEYTAVAPINGGIPTISLLSADVISGVVNTATSGGPGKTSVNSAKLEVKNRFYDTEGTFASLINNRTRVTREVIIFPNDSMRLGTEGKRRIQQLLAVFKESDDLINVIGCSNGTTKLAIGNEGLALGRANRITQELLTLGVPNRNILDDACWSEESAGERFPSRGVVIDLMRSTS